MESENRKNQQAEIKKRLYIEHLRKPTIISCEKYMFFKFMLKI